MTIQNAFYLSDTGQTEYRDEIQLQLGTLKIIVSPDLECSAATDDSDTVKSMYNSEPAVSFNTRKL